MNKPRVIIAPTRPNGRRYWVIMAFLPALIAIFATQFLLLPAHLHVEEVLLEKNRLMLVLSSTQLTAACPHCSSLSAHVHSHYTRTLVDLPCQERAAGSGAPVFLPCRRVRSPDLCGTVSRARTGLCTTDQPPASEALSDCACPRWQTSSASA